MFQTIGYNVIDAIAKCLDVKLYQEIIKGKSVNREMNYDITDNDEIEDLFNILNKIKVFFNIFYRMRIMIVLVLVLVLYYQIIKELELKMYVNVLI